MKNKLKTLILMLTCCSLINTTYLIAESSTQKHPDFIEDFESGISKWEMTDSNAWALSKDESGNHLLCLMGPSNYEPPVRSPKSIAILKEMEWEDFVLEVDVKQTGKEYGHRDLCFFFGYQDPTHYYYIHIATKADEHAHSVFLVNGAPRISIAKERTEGVEWGNNFHKIRIIRDSKEGKIEAYFDNMSKPIMVAEDKTFIKGKIGLGSFDDTGCFDNLKIWKLNTTK
ncbi:MAG: hypothetical protein N3G21_04435 [Candidatus Hydrogenedentes bacterium]|nr:hypothetical protein [Candidatus Hydrogenedentota bacterium]